MNSQSSDPAETTAERELDDVGYLARLHELDRKLREYYNGTRPDGPSDLPKLFQTSTAIISLLGVGLYGAVRFGQQIFYNSLHITPEEVGLTYASTLSRAAVVIAAIFAPVILGVSGIFTAGTVAGSPDTSVLRSILGWGLWLSVPAILMSAFTVIFFLTLGPAVTAALALPFFALPLVVLLALLIWKGGGALKPSTLVRQPAPVLAAASLITVVAFVVSGLIAQASASKVRAGEELFGSASFGLLGLRAEHVKLSGELPKGYAPPDDISLLGRADGTIILYDYDRNQPLRIPAAGVVVSHR